MVVCPIAGPLESAITALYSAGKVVLHPGKQSTVNNVAKQERYFVQ